MDEPGSGKLDVGLNGLFLHYPHSGTGRYVNQLIRRARTRVDLSVVGARALPPDGQDGRPGEIRLLSTPFDRLSLRLAKVWFEQVAAARAFRQLGVKLVHCPYFAPPVRPLVPTVVTIHDLVTVLLPEYRRTVAERLYVSLVLLGIKSASGIITDSEASAADLVGRLRVSRDKIRVIALGVDPRFRPMATADERAWAVKMRAELGISPPYLLYVGSFERRKNLDRLLAAFACLKRERRIPHALVLVGSPRFGQPFFYDPRPDVERLDLAGSVILAGARTDAEVVALQAGADAFVFPSLYEGFGLPPLEAMACGTPVVCSNVSSMPEVVGDAGVLFDPRDVRALANAIGRVVEDEKLRRALGCRGRERAATYTWEATATATVAAYDATIAAG